MGIVSEPILFERIHQLFFFLSISCGVKMVGMIFVRKVTNLTTKIFGSTNFNHILAELFVSYKSVVDTQEVPLFCTSS